MIVCTDSGHSAQWEESEKIRISLADTTNNNSDSAVAQTTTNNAATITNATTSECATYTASTIETSTLGPSEEDAIEADLLKFIAHSSSSPEEEEEEDGCDECPSPFPFLAHRLTPD